MFTYRSSTISRLLLKPIDGLKITHSFVEPPECLDRINKKNTIPFIKHPTWSPLTIVLKDPGLQIILPSDSLSLPWLQRAGVSLGCGCEKNNSSGSIFLFSAHALVKFRQARLCKKKNIFSGSDKSGFAKKQTLKNWFFGTALVKLRQARLCKQKHFFRL